MNTKLGILLIVIGLLFLLQLIFTVKFNEEKMIDLNNKNIEEVKVFAKENNLRLIIEEEYSENVGKGYVINQSIKQGEKIKNKKELTVIISLGKSKDVYEKYNVNELGNVPIMMYHGIHNVKSDDTGYTGGNIDKEGYQRTNEAFRQDLLFYYENNYRMVSLKDYVNKIIDVEIGKSPIILTFDDGLRNNINVTGIDDNGNIIIDPNSAVGILEEFKEKYPDFNVTATFFLNGGLFQQQKYNEQIIKWLIDNGYDIGNHSYGHSNFADINEEDAQMEIGKMYQLLDKIIPNKYVNIVSLPFGSPYKKEHNNFSYIIKGEYNDVNYVSDAVLRVGWESDKSPFNKNFDKYFLKRIRAYDNNGLDYDIEMNFKNLKENKYISDGNKDKIVIPKDKLDYISKENNLEVITY